MRIFCRIRHFPVHLRILGRRGLVFAVKTGNAISPVFVHLRVLGGRGVAFAGKTANAIVFFFSGMVRKLKYHEKKLLKKVDFITWKSDRDHREIKIIRKYHLQKREDYTK